MTPFQALQWIAVGFVAVLAVLLLTLAVVAAVQQFKKNPLKQSFDIDKEQDK